MKIPEERWQELADFLEQALFDLEQVYHSNLAFLFRNGTYNWMCELLERFSDGERSDDLYWELQEVA